MSDIYIGGNTTAAGEAIKALIAAFGTKFRVVGRTEKSEKQDKQQTKADIFSARFFVLALDSAADFENREIASEWQYFLDEIAWKRKSVGEVIIFSNDELDFSRVPYKLKNKTYFTYSECSELADYCLQQEIISNEVVATTGAVPIVKQIKYSPRPAEVEQIKFSARAPSVESFDGDKKYHMKQTSARYDDHIYETNASGNNSSEVEYRNARNANNNKVEKKSGKGCVALVIVMVLLAMIAIVAFVVVTGNMRYELLDTRGEQITDIFGGFSSGSVVNPIIKTLEGVLLF